jgi:hypothetical protein
MLDQAQKSTQSIHHGFQNTFFKRYQHNLDAMLCMIWYRRYTENIWYCPTIQRNTAVPPLHRSCHGVRICRRRATARKSAVSSFVRLSWLISVQRDKSEWVSSMGHAYQTFVNLCETVCLTNTSLVMYMLGPE